MTTETTDERRARQTDEYDHTHDVNGHPIQLSQTQDAEGDHCHDCKRSLYTGNFDVLADTQPHNHAIGCSNYQPHPTSIAAQA
jgi:hypothetical protein